MPGASEPADGPAGDDVRLTFPDLPRLELDQLLQQLVDRAGEVMAAQGRLRGLLRANQAIMADLALPVVLRRIVAAARELVGARYAALGVLSGDGRLAEFVHDGMPRELVARIGDLPQGKGLLGAVIDEGRPIRLRSIGEDPRSSGFPPEHPPMGSFLGVPIHVREDVFGSIYLAESVRGEFSAEDEELIRALAATAAVAIDNARLYQASKRQAEWLAATAAVTRQMLDPAGSRPLAMIAERSRQLADADLTVVMLPEEDGRALRIVVADAGNAVTLPSTGLSGRRLPCEGTLAARALAESRPLRLDDPITRPDLAAVLASADFDLGPTLVVPLVGSKRTEGVLTVVRTPGRSSFGQEDVDMVAAFANQAAVALELAEARAERQQLEMLDERERIAADLHDLVIQRLFAAGLSLQSVAARLRPGAEADRLKGVIGDLDDTIAQIRTTIFALKQVSADDSVRSRILAVVKEAAHALGFTPVLRFTGPTDTLLQVREYADAAAGSLTDDLIAVLREALSNVARHAHASSVEVDVVVTTSEEVDRLTVVVEDDGVGPGSGTRRSGLANLRRRAERRGGAFELEPRVPCGTRVCWTVPLR